MGGKKKKSLANKLAKMSDEERARYLQHKAEIEEEAKRRKEQLIATFMKKKIKKEGAFSRLNMAKINQNWHQILRKIKVKEMKDEVEHLKRWIERVLEYKNRRISKLMDELEEAEEQYLNNFNSHSTHLDGIIENQNDYIEILQSQYQEELDDLLDQARKEEVSITENSNSEIDYLKTVSYGQENQAVKELRESWERYSKQLYEIEYNALECGISRLNNEQVKKVVTECVKNNQTLNKIWELTFSMSNEDDASTTSSSSEEEVPVTKGIANNLNGNRNMKSFRTRQRFKRSKTSKMYNSDTSTQRKYESSSTTTEEPMTTTTMSEKSEENNNNVGGADDACILQCIFEKLDMNRSKLKHLQKTRSETEAALWQQILRVVRAYVQRTDTRRSHLQELRRMDTDSAEEIRKNEERITKDEELIKILKTNHEDLLKQKTDKLQSLEAEENQLNIKFLKIRKELKVHLALDEKQLRLLIATSNETLEELNLVSERGGHILALSITCNKFETERERISKWLPIIPFAEAREKEDEVKEGASVGLTDDEKLIQKALEKGFSLPKLEEVEPEEPKSKVRPKTSFSATTETIDLLPTPESKLAPIEDIKIEARKFEEKEKSPTNFLDKCYENLEKLENFWMIYNKCEIDVMELKQEKVTLETENKQLRGLIRAVLEAAVLAKSTPDSKVSTRVQSKRRSAYSAPLRRITFQ